MWGEKAALKKVEGDDFVNKKVSRLTRFWQFYSFRSSARKQLSKQWFLWSKIWKLVSWKKKKKKKKNCKAEVVLQNEAAASSPLLSTVQKRREKRKEKRKAKRHRKGMQKEKRNEKQKEREKKRECVVHHSKLWGGGIKI